MGPSFERSSSSSTNVKPQDNGEHKEKVINPYEDHDEIDTILYYDNNNDKVGRGLEAKVYQFVDGGYKELKLVKSMWEADNGPDKTGLTAYNAVGKLTENTPRFFGKSRAPRSATFVAAIRLFEGKENDGRPWPEQLPTSQEFYDHIGVHPWHEKATGAMWERIYLDRHTCGAGSEPVLDLAEFNMIGRSLEKVLQVDIVPATFKDDGESQNDPKHPKKYSALVSNLFIKANVDLKALL